MLWGNSLLLNIQNGAQGGEEPSCHIFYISLRKELRADANFDPEVLQIMTRSVRSLATAQIRKARARTCTLLSTIFLVPYV